MRRYETVFIVNPELSEDQHQLLFDKLNGLVPEDQGMLVKLDEWGNKRLAYEIKKHTRRLRSTPEDTMYLWTFAGMGLWSRR